MKRIGLVVLAMLALFIFASGAYAQGSSVTVTMNAQNGSGEDGMATLTDMGNGQTQVVINISNGTAEPQPAHIHDGPCANLNPTPKYPLNNVVNGTSQTTINVSLTDLINGNFAINVHKSKTEATTYVSCGDILAAQVTGGGTVTPGMPTTGGGDQYTLLLALALVALGTAATGLKLRLARRKA